MPPGRWPVSESRTDLNEMVGGGEELDAFSAIENGGAHARPRAYVRSDASIGDASRLRQKGSIARVRRSRDKMADAHVYRIVLCDDPKLYFTYIYII